MFNVNIFHVMGKASYLCADRSCLFNFFHIFHLFVFCFVLSLQEWLQHCGIGEISMQLPYDDPQPDPDCKLVSYQVR